MNLYLQMDENEYEEYKKLKQNKSQDLSDRNPAELIFAAIAAINKCGGRVEEGSSVNKSSYRPTTIKMAKIQIGDVTYMASIEQIVR